MFDGSFPEEVQETLSPDIFPVLTDYNSKTVKSFKYIYEQFDKVDFTSDSMPDRYWFAGQFADIERLQMISLTPFDSGALKRIRQQYQNFHSSVTSSVIPDDIWHFIFIVFVADGKEYGIFLRLYGKSHLLERIG